MRTPSDVHFGWFWTLRSAVGHQQTSDLSSCNSAEGAGDAKRTQVTSDAQYHASSRCNGWLPLGFFFFPAVQLSHMVWLWQISTEQWSQPSRSRVFSYLVPTMSHRVWWLHLAGFMLKKGHNEITQNKTAYCGKVVTGEKTKSFWEKTKALILGKPHRETTLKKVSRSCQMLWHTLALLSCLSCSLLYLIQNQFLFVELVQRMTKGPNSDLCCRKAGTSLLMERELKHSLDRAAGPHYKHFMRVSEHFQRWL